MLFGFGLLAILVWLPVILLVIYISLAINGCILILGCTFVGCNKPTFHSAMFLALLMFLIRSAIVLIVFLPLWLAGIIDPSEGNVELQVMLYSLPLLVPASAYTFSWLLQITLIQAVKLFIFLIVADLVWMMVSQMWFG